MAQIDSPLPALAQIEAIFCALASDLAKSRPLTLPIQSRPRSRPSQPRQSHSRPEIRSRAHKFVFPSSKPAEAWRFTVMLKILEQMHHALAGGVVATKRDIYYQDPELFGKQSVVDKYVDDIAYTFGLQRSCLNVVAAPRGLIVGCFTITRVDGAIVRGDAEAEGMLVPNLRENDRLDISEASWILVIEKEATFRTLSQLQVFARSQKKGILMTAKGYPDRASRAFLHSLAAADACVPIYALADYDPDGLAIVATYTCGSIALAHESLAISTPTLEWLGIRCEDLPACGEDAASYSTELASDQGGLLRLSERDRAKARAMLERNGGGSTNGQWARELKVMLMLNIKAEIQVLDRGEGLESWITRKLGL